MGLIRAADVRSTWAGVRPVVSTGDLQKKPSDEKREHAVDFYKIFSAHREWAGGRPDPVFFSTDVEGFRKMDPDNFGIVHAKPKPGAQGYRVRGMGEWRTASGDAVDIVDAAGRVLARG